MNDTDRIGPIIKRCSHDMKKNIDKQLSGFDLTSTQLNTLIFTLCSYNEHRLIHQRNIEQFLKISNPTVTGILDRLSVKGLIKRELCPEDARVKYILPTNKALELDKKIKPIFEQTEDDALKGFSDQEKEALLNYLKRIINNLKEGEK